jgi:hypothetical protein
VHPFHLLALAAALAVGSVACGGSDSDGGAAAATTVEPPPLDVLTLESGYTSGVDDLGNRYNSVGAVVTNTAAITACGVSVEFAILDAGGAVLASKTEKLPVVAPSAALPLSTSGLGGGSPDEPASFTATVVSADSFDPSGTCPGQGLTLKATDGRIDSAVEYINGFIRNPTDEVIESVNIRCVLRDAFGAIVGGDSGTMRGTISPRGSSDLKIRMLWAPPKATAAECSATT